MDQVWEMVAGPVPACQQWTIVLGPALLGRFYHAGTGPPCLDRRQALLRASDRASVGSQHGICYGSRFRTVTGPITFADWDDLSACADDNECVSN
jgi:hypothetical protein